MIVWLNGTFGVGKTTTSSELTKADDRFRHFDPELVGSLLTRSLPDHQVADFQQFESWRRLVPVVADEVSRFTGQHLIAAQTVLVYDYWNDITKGLAGLGHEILHVVLDADAASLHSRIDSDDMEPEHIRPWRHQHVEIYQSARDWMLATADLVIDTAVYDAPSASQQIRTEVAARI